jgi:hypothetical protein
MKSFLLSFLSNRLFRPLKSGLARCVYLFQHLLMKAAVAFSLKLCLFTARILLGANDRADQQTSQSF